MIYKIRKEEVNTLVFTLLITFSLVTGVECLIYTAYQKLNVTPRNLDDRSVVARRGKPFVHAQQRVFHGRRTQDLNKTSNSRP